MVLVLLVVVVVAVVVTVILLSSLIALDCGRGMDLGLVVRENMVERSSDRDPGWEDEVDRLGNDF